MDNVELIITPQEKDLGGFSVRRVLPSAEHRMVGPFIFFDHMGPANFAPGQGIDVRPHPHVNLATVTYLFEGKIRHRDSLGSDQLIVPGDINWMTAGHGIVHSERTPDERRKSGGPMSGIQLWVALPNEHEEIAPSFTHYPKDTLPEKIINGVKIKLLLGDAYGMQSPVAVLSKLFYLSADMPKDTKLDFEVAVCEMAVYVARGTVKIDNRDIPEHTMAVCKSRSKITITASENSHIMFLGGESLGERHIYWNFVSSSKDKIQEAMQDWKNGPGESGSRFPKIPDDNKEFIPLPSLPDNAKPTIM